MGLKPPHKMRSLIGGGRNPPPISLPFTLYPLPFTLLRESFFWYLTSQIKPGFSQEGIFISQTRQDFYKTKTR